MTSTTLVRFAASLGAVLLLGLAVAPARAADSVGVWQAQDGRGRVRTEHRGPGKANLCGYVVWMEKPTADGRPTLGTSNPDEKGRPVLGHEMMIGLKPADECRYEGKVYNADNGKLYDVKVWSEEPADLSVKGCRFSYLCYLCYLCMTQGWKRVTDALPGRLQGPTDAAGGPRSDR